MWAKCEQFSSRSLQSDEQERISERLKSVTSRCNRRCRGIPKKLSPTEKTGLMQDLLTGKVRVKVDDAEEVAADA